MDHKSLKKNRSSRPKSATYVMNENFFIHHYFTLNLRAPSRSFYKRHNIVVGSGGVNFIFNSTSIYYLNELFICK